MITRCLACFLVILLACSISLQSQDPLTLSMLEDSLSSIQRQIQKTGNDSIRKSLNLRFRDHLKSAIGLPGSFTYPFDALKKLSKMTPPDKTFRIYNWNLPMTNGGNQYFCLLQIRDIKNKKTFTITELSDKSDSIPDPEHCVLSARSWYGALYYSLIAEKAESGMIYTLLGWEGKNFLQMQKIIEILTFNENKQPCFGKKIFMNYKDGQYKRVIFGYSPVATMVLRYEEQFPGRSPMIICDRLVTVESQEGTSQVLVPAGDIYDGFLYENGRWNFLEGVDARNR